MTRTTYYEDLKALARQVRAQYGLRTARVQLRDLRRIYRAEGIRIELWPPRGTPRRTRLRQLRGAYLDEPPLSPWVMIARSLPAEQRIFTLAHELKHHLRDHSTGLVPCVGDLGSDPREIGAEIFAAELIFPDDDFRGSMAELGIRPGACSAETIVRLKAATRTTLSYSSLAKRAEFLGFAPRGSLRDVRWKTLAEQIFGEPLYKRLVRARRQRAERPPPGLAPRNL